MIELVIPTFKRLNRQITLSNIPKNLLENVTLVVQPQEESPSLIRYNPGVVLNYAQAKFGNVALDHTGTNESFYLIIYKN